ncbi:MAG: DUF6364 family protein [archaeon GB-1867-005]|nr:DUF6364 family protein [Candidatus Culexmicrobium cathedralense]
MGELKDPRVKLTITVDEDVLKMAKGKAKECGITLSRAIEKFLKFFADPHVYCFKCGEKFRVSEAEICPKCGWLSCPSCSACRCDLSEETAIAIFHMRRVYEDLLVRRIK